MSELTQERLKSLVRYDPTTGLMTYKYRKMTRGRPSARGGKLVGSRTGMYVHATIEGTRTSVHRLAWLYMTGYFPEHDIDHINRDHRDNRWCNLRHVSRICNMRNTSISTNNVSGVKGVHYSPDRSKWVAMIRVNYKRYNLGRYTLFHNAVCARLAAEQCFNWSGCDSSSPAYQYVKKNIQRSKK